MKKTTIALIGLCLLFAQQAAAAPTLVTTVYNGSHQFPLWSMAQAYPIKSCYTQANYEGGNCDYVYTCYAILPMGATSFSHAFQRECIEVTQIYGVEDKTMSFSFSPPKGYRLAVTWFVVKLNYTYNNTTQRWNAPTTTIINKEAAEIISLCEEGKMLRGTVCYDAQSFCVNSLGTNMCDNPYQLYMLDYGQGFEPTNYAHMCADRELDKVCDAAVSLYCSDINLNGICDESEVQIGENACIDDQENWVCDDVETTGTFCRVYYEPVCDTATNVTYPNSCFADAAGKTGYAVGECAPIEIEIQCRQDTDCWVPCQGVATSCNNYQCQYMGECNPSVLQCSVAADCPNSPCIGVLAECNTTNNTCQYTGKCITQPVQPASIWSILAGIWALLWNWVKTMFGW